MPPGLAKKQKVHLGPGWLPQGYTSALAGWRQQFPSELIPFMIPGFYRRKELYAWSDESEETIRESFVTCCLVCREWNKTFTPILYRNITLGPKTTTLTRSLLRRTLEHTRPSHKTLVVTMHISSAEDGTASNFWLLVLLNLRRD